MASLEYHRQWRAKNRDKINEQRRAKHAERAESINRRRRASYASDGGVALARSLAWAKKWRAENPERQKAKNKADYARYTEQYARRYALYKRTERGKTVVKAANDRWLDSNPIAHEYAIARANLRNRTGLRASQLEKEVIEIEVIRLRVMRLVKHGRETVRPHTPASAS